jgi:hypothetical protein
MVVSEGCAGVGFFILPAKSCAAVHHARFAGFTPTQHTQHNNWLWLLVLVPPPLRPLPPKSTSVVSDTPEAPQLHSRMTRLFLTTHYHPLPASTPHHPWQVPTPSPPVRRPPCGSCWAAPRP